MQVFRTIKKLKAFLGSVTSDNKSIGMVPTMGALHQGHLNLVQKAVSENDIVVVSVFVNPTQFDNKDDLRKYPKSLSNDSKLLSSLDQEIVIFAPAVSEIYPEGVSSKNYNFDGLDKTMEGEYRAGHFNGVATVVEALLRIVMPERAYFGEKDFQQLQIIRKMVKNLNLPIDIVSCPIVRESSGLAMSSRNERLSKRLRAEAAFIYKTLQLAKAKFGTKSAKYVGEWVQDQFDEHPILKLEYFKVVHSKTLKGIVRKRKSEKYRAFIAVYAEGVRLIDNIALN